MKFGINGINAINILQSILNGYYGTGDPEIITPVLETVTDSLINNVSKYSDVKNYALAIIDSGPYCLATDENLYAQCLPTEVKNYTLSIVPKVNTLMNYSDSCQYDGDFGFEKLDDLQEQFSKLNITKVYDAVVENPIPSLIGATLVSVALLWNATKARNTPLINIDIDERKTKVSPYQQFLNIKQANEMNEPALKVFAEGIEKLPPQSLALAFWKSKNGAEKITFIGECKKCVNKEICSKTPYSEWMNKQEIDHIKLQRDPDHYFELLSQKYAVEQMGLTMDGTIPTSPDKKKSAEMQNIIITNLEKLDVVAESEGAYRLNFKSTF